MTETPDLKPASESPWYVLMTVAGEQTGFLIDDDLHTRNLRFWDGSPMPRSVRSACRHSGLNVGLPSRYPQSASLAILCRQVFRNSEREGLGHGS